MLEDYGTGTDTATGTLDTWITGSTTSSWSLTDTSTAGSTKTFFGKLKIRDATTFALLSEAEVDLRAFKTV